VDSTSHLNTLYCKRFVRLRVLFKTHIMGQNNYPLKNNPYSNTYNAGWQNHLNLSECAESTSAAMKFPAEK